MKQLPATIKNAIVTVKVRYYPYTQGHFQSWRDVVNAAITDDEERSQDTR